VVSNGVGLLNVFELVEIAKLLEVDGLETGTLDGVEVEYDVEPLEDETGPLELVALGDIELGDVGGLGGGLT